MNTHNPQKNSGFTLIEVLVYLALFGIIFIGAVAGAYSIMESTARNHTRATMQEEGEFMLAKINWAITNASTVQVPAGGRLMATVGSVNLEFKQDGNNLILNRDTAPAQPLNAGDVAISDLFFVDISTADGTLSGINYGFNVSGKTSDGKELVSEFESTAYLRK